MIILVLVLQHSIENRSRNTILNQSARVFALGYSPIRNLTQWGGGGQYGSHMIVIDLARPLPFALLDKLATKRPNKYRRNSKCPFN